MRNLAYILSLLFCTCAASQDVIVIDSLFNKAEEFKAITEWSKAATYYEQASQMELKSQSPRYDSLARQLRFLAVCQIKESFNDKAQQNLEKVITLHDQKLLKDYNNYTQAANELSAMLYNQGDYITAITQYDKLLTTLRTEKGKVNKDYAYVLRRLADCYRLSNQNQKADKLFDELITLYEKKLGVFHKGYLVTLNQQAINFENLKDYEAAIGYYQKALVAYKEEFSYLHDDHLVVLNNTLRLMERLEKNEESIPLYLKLIELTKEVEYSNTEDYSYILGKLSYAYRATKEYENSLKYLEMAMPIHLKNSGKDLDYAWLINSTGICFEQLQKTDLAMEAYKSAYNIAKQDKIMTMKNGEKLLKFEYNKIGKATKITIDDVGSMDVTYDSNGEIKRVEIEDGSQMAMQVTQTFQNLLAIVKPANLNYNL